MPSKFRIRHIFRPLVKSLAKFLSKVGISPNIATMMMLSFSIFSLISLVFFASFLSFSIFVFLTGLFDGIDGAIARINNKATKLGGFFDSSMDRLSEFVIFLALLIYFWNATLLGLDMKFIIFIGFFASLMISYTRSRAETFLTSDCDTSVETDIGLMARSERLFYLVITSLISQFFNLFKEFLFIFMWLVILTALFRYIRIYKYIKEKERIN